MLFENYKMQLAKKHNDSTPLAYDLRAGTQPLLKVITLSLKYVKDQAMEDINRSQPKVMSAHEIKWVVTGQLFSFGSDCGIRIKSVLLACVDVPNLTRVVRTVPAIWRDSAKGMMRKAAFGERNMQGT